MPLNEEQKQQVEEIAKDVFMKLNKTGSFTDRRIIDIPTDLYAVANKKYVDSLSIFPVYVVANEKIYYTSYFESLDGWQKATGASQVYTPQLGGASIQTGTTINTQAAMNTEVSIGDIDWSKNSGFQSLLKFSATTDQTIYFGLGDLSIGDGTEEGYGFKIVNGTLSALATQSNGVTATETLTNISTGVTLTNINVYKAIKDGNSIFYYVNGDLKTTITSGLPNGTSPIVLLYSIKNSAAANKIIYLGHGSAYYEF